MKKIRDIFSGNEGFTLIELLIVIVILGVLAAIAVPNLMGLTDTANQETVRANMRTLLTEIEAERASGESTGITTLNAYVAIDEMEGIEITSSPGNVDEDYDITANPTADDLNWSVTITDGTITTSGF